MEILSEPVSWAHLKYLSLTTVICLEKFTNLHITFDDVLNNEIHTLQYHMFFFNNSLCRANLSQLAQQMWP